MSEQLFDDTDEAKPVQKKSGDTIESGPTFAAAESLVIDLSNEIVQMLPKTGERVTCRRIFGNYYRCNWWTAQGTGEYDNPGMRGLMVTTHRVSRSEFLHVTKGAKGLIIQSAVVGKR